MRSGRKGFRPQDHRLTFGDQHYCWSPFTWRTTMPDHKYYREWDDRDITSLVRDTEAEVKELKAEVQELTELVERLVKKLVPSDADDILYS